MIFPLSLRIAAGSILKYLFNDLFCFSHLFVSFSFKKNDKMLFNGNVKGKEGKLSDSDQ